MGYTRHLSRREIAQMIPLLSSGALLVPLRGEQRNTQTPGVIRGKLVDDATGQPVAAKMRVTDVFSGEALFPDHAIKTMPKNAEPGARCYFYARGSYEIAVPPGRYRIEVVRGICHDQVVQQAEVGAGIAHVHDFRVPVLRDLRAAGWYCGNTHTHYHLQIDEDPDERLRTVPPAEALDVSAISYLIRGDSPYITNRYPIGRLPQFSRDGTLIDMGQECRNNLVSDGIGYGHCLFLNIPHLVQPVSTGALAFQKDAPDFPTLSMICAEAKRVGGTTIWCHNGAGMEAPVAAALGNVDAYNVADGGEADYNRYYNLLNCGFRLPASTGTDWWIYDHNRVFVRVEGDFTYDSWLSGLRAGRTFVSNGPLIELLVNGQGPGASIEGSGEPLQVRASVISRLPFDRLEIVQDGRLVAEQTAMRNRTARLESELPAERSGWVAARVRSSAKTHGGYTVFAHTSPVYVRVAGTASRRGEAAGAFVDELEASMRFIRKSYSFASDADRATAIGRFEQTRQFYLKLLASGA